jgi:hypothetical protein
MAFNNPFPNFIDIGYSDNDFNYNFILNNVEILATQTGIHTINFVQNNQYFTQTINYNIGDPFIFPKQWFLLQGIIIFEIVQPDLVKYQYTFDSIVFEQFRIQKVKEVPFFFGNQKLGGLASEYTLLQVLEAIGLIVPISGGATEATQLLVKANTDNLNIDLFNISNLLTTLNSIVATESTLTSVNNNTSNISNISAVLDVALSTRADIANQIIIEGKIDTSNSWLNANNNLLVDIKANQTNGTQIVNLITGYNLEVTQLLIKGVLDAIKLKTDNLDVALSTRNQQITQIEVRDNIGATNETVAPADTSTSGLNGLFKRLLQRITTLITNLGTPFQAGGSIGNTSFGAIQSGAWTVTANAGTNLNTSLLATESTQTTQNTRIGDLTETAPATDTASSGLNGRLQRIAQRLTSLIALLPSSLGIKTSAGSLSVTDSKEQTYSASITNLGVASTPTDIFTIIGSASKTVKVRKIVFTASKTANAIFDVLIIKRSTANTGGTSTTPTLVPHVSTNSAATAVVRAYTANPTLGTAIGTLKALKAWIIGGVTAAPHILEIDFKEQPITLIGVAELLSINLNSTGTTVAGNQMNISIEFTEE